jgi:hypothetical protein
VITRVPSNPSAIQHFISGKKHISIKYHFIRSLQENQIIDVSFVPSTEQKADMFTKPPSRPLFNKMCTNLEIHDNSVFSGSASLRGDVEFTQLRILAITAETLLQQEMLFSNTLLLKFV